MSPKRVVVLGREGMLGSMVRVVLGPERGLRVRGTQRSRREDLDYFDALLSDPPLESVLAADGGCDFVVNCAGVSAARIRDGGPMVAGEAMRVNGGLPGRLALAAAKAGARVIHISTDGVFSGLKGPYYEDSSPDAEDVYGKSKLAGEVRAPHVLNLRCSLIGTDRRRGGGLFEWLRGHKPGSRVPGFVNHRWNGVTTLQFARLCRALILEADFDGLVGNSPVVHFCPNRPVSKYELLSMLKEKAGVPVDVVRTKGESERDRVLMTRFNYLPELFGKDLAMERAIDELFAFTPRIDIPKKGSRT